MRQLLPTVLAAGLAAAGWMPVQAHVSIAQASAPVGSHYKAVFRVPHGCDGAATTGLSVQIPEGVIAVKPQPKPGWQLSTTTSPYARPYTLHGERMSAGVTTVTWSGGLLPDDRFDEFAFIAWLTPELQPGTTLYFPVIQTCTQGTMHWTEIPAPGSPGHHHGDPAPGVRLTPGGHDPS